MDAKPQRPLRAFQASQNNENMPPMKQAIHQRHKSAGNLKAMPITGALNAPPKRTAFGDLSNTARALADASGKNVIKNQVKSAIASINSRDNRVDDKENGRAMTDEHWARGTAASKAAINVSKYHSAAPIPTASQVPTVKPALRQYSSALLQPTNSSLVQPLIKQGIPKKATAVYFDRKDIDVAIRPEIASSTDDLVNLVDNQIKHPRQYKSQPQLRVEQPYLRRTQSKYHIKSDKVADVEEEIDIDDDVTEAAYEDALEQVSRDIEISARNDDSTGTVEVNDKQICRVDFDTEPQTASIQESAHYAKALPAPAVTSEPEEYWDEDEEQDLYDEQGYTTAHSYRSHGDNTTGGATTMVAPKVTVHVQRELEVAKAFVLENQSEEELEEEAWDVSMVAEYGEEIFEYMRTLEGNMLPNPHYMDIQTEIQWSMRSVLMDWLVQVHHRFSLLPETLFLTVNYIDRFLSVKIVSLGKLQLVGATAIFLAAKYEEINCPSVGEIVYMVDSGYTTEEILKAERFMLSMLQFELGWPGPMSFLRRISKADDYDLETRTLAKYFLEVTIMDERFVGSPPSFLAAGAHCLSRFMLKKGDWTPAHVHYSGYTISQLKPLIMMIHECCLDARKHHGAVFDKYSSPKYKRASTYVEAEVNKGFKLALPSITPALMLTDQSLEGDDSHLVEHNRMNFLIPIEG
ncbi:cyclin-like protein [Lasiosphaeris hirsuta]|uniref:Cyclin-like protein n=1 Tax=Lasiosphaeris hirsuta TaxID=260670 RepID=A0AA40APW3_9PEZI|nr:cyclin-like protein [Lasiosphaeris hirsuta]